METQFNLHFSWEQIQLSPSSVPVKSQLSPAFYYGLLEFELPNWPFLIATSLVVPVKSHAFFWGYPMETSRWSQFDLSPKSCQANLLGTASPAPQNSRGYPILW